MEGRIKLHRQSQENELYFLDPFTKRQAWQDLLLTTNHKDGHICVRGNIIEIKRGQNGYSEDTLGKRRQWSRDKVRRYLNYLETIQQIIQQKSKVKSIITIINRDKYQGNNTTDDTTDKHQTIQQTNTNKKENNVKNEKEVIPPSEEFEKFWKQFPHARKGKKRESEIEFKKHNVVEVMEEVELLNWKIEIGLQDGKFIPACERWIRDFVQTAESIKSQDLKKIVYSIMDNKEENRKEQAIRFKQDFGEDVAEKYRQQRSKEKNGLTLKFT